MAKSDDSTGGRVFTGTTTSTLSELLHSECVRAALTEDERIATHDKLVTEMSSLMSERLGTPYQVFIERNVCRREWDVDARCLSCGCYWTRSPGAAELGGTREIVEGYIQTTLSVRASEWADEDDICRCVDGLPQSECLRRFKWRQREDSSEFVTKKYASSPAVFLSPAQRDAARVAWSAELKRRQAEAREKERATLCVDDDRWEP